MSSFILIMVCLALGVIFRTRNILPETSAIVLNRFVIYISLPALTLKEVHNLPFDKGQLAAISMAWVLFLLSLLFFWLLRKYFSASKIMATPETFGALVLMAGLGNTSFVGFPLLQALFGDDAIHIGLLVDQPGTFFVAGTLGLMVASLLSRQKAVNSATRFRAIAKQVALFPPTQALVLALLLRPWAYPAELNLVLERIAATLMPVALVAVGFQLHFDRSRFSKEWRALALGLGFKLILSPLLIYFIYVQLFNLHGRTIQIVLAEAAMAPMITAGIIVSEYNLNSQLGSLMIGLGIPLSLLTVPLWQHLFSSV